MDTHTSHAPRLVRLGLATFVIVALMFTSGISFDVTSDAHAKSSGTPAQPGQPAGKNPTHVWGARLFDQAISWVNDGKPGVNKTDSFYADLHDVQLEVDDSHQEGYLRLWFQAPDKFRQEWRQTRQLTAQTPITTKILRGERMWVVSANGVPRRIHGTAEGAKAVKQLQRDRDRLADIAKFMTIEGLKGPSVTFEYMGPKSGTGTFGGDWVKIVRTFPGGAEMEFFFAYEVAEVNGQKRVSKATYPGVVVVKGDAARRERTEAYVLSNWKKGVQFKYPGKIEAFHRRDWVANDQYRRFLLAFPMDIRVNPRILPARFDDPTRAR